MRTFYSRASFLALMLWLVLPLCAQPSGEVPDSLDLNELIRLTLHNHPSLKRAQAEAQAARAKVEQSRSFELPSADASATYLRIDPVPEFEIEGHPLELAPHDNFDMHIGGYYNLYDFGKARSQTQLSRGRLKSAEDAAQLVRSDLAFAAARAFYSILFIRRTLIVQDQEIAALSEHLRVAQSKVDAGTAIQYDVLSTQVRLAAVQNQRLDALNALETQRTEIRELLGLPGNSQVNVTGELSVETIHLDKDSLARVALGQRPEIQLSDDALKVARIQQQLAARSDLPVLRAGAQYGVKNGYEPDLGAWRGNWAGRAELQVPLYHGRQRHYNEQEADAVLGAEESKRQELERRIRSQVDRAVDDLRTTLSKLSASDVRIQQAQDAVSIARIRYSSGAITNVDVLDAETSLAEAELAREQIVFSCVMASTALRQALGELPATPSE
jgi:outer membrane protein